MPIKPHHSAPNTRSSLQEYLAAVGWDAPDFQTDWLQRTTQEESLLRQQDAHLTLDMIAQNEGLGWGITRSMAVFARGKRDVERAREVEDRGLTVEAQRVIVLHNIFGGSQWHQALATGNLAEMAQTASHLDEVLPKWKRSQQLITIPWHTLDGRIQRYDQEFGTKWRSNFVILSQDPAVIAQRTALYDQHFGADWRMRPILVTNQPRTVLASERCLRAVGITRDNTSTGPYFNLLCTTPELKRKKVRFIRETILGHTQIHASSERLPLHVNVARRYLNEEERATEQRELQELTDFLHHLKARGFGASIGKIAAWAWDHGYLFSSTEVDEGQ